MGWYRRRKRQREVDNAGPTSEIGWPACRQREQGITETDGQVRHCRAPFRTKTRLFSTEFTRSLCGFLKVSEWRLSMRYMGSRWNRLPRANVGAKNALLASSVLAPAFPASIS
jgi:hypothetical protein